MALQGRGLLTPLPQPPRIGLAYLGPGLASWEQVWGPCLVQDTGSGASWLCPLPDLSRPPFSATGFLAGFPMARKEKSRSLRQCGLHPPASFDFVSVFKGQPLCGFTSDVSVEPPGV